MIKRQARYKMALDLGLNGIIDIDMGYGSFDLGQQQCDHLQRLNKDVLKPYHAFVLVDMEDNERIAHKGIGLERGA